MFQCCRRAQVPLVFNLAGGYNGAHTIELHTRTIKAAELYYRTSGLGEEPAT